MSYFEFLRYSDLENHIHNACNKAVETACNRLLGQLQVLIDSEFYDQFEPDFYKRTYQFYRSALTQMLSKACGKVFMDENAMHYKVSKSGWSWSGRQQLEAANAGSHGGWTTPETVKHRYWDAFEEYCDANAIKILKQELKRNGLPIK